MTISELQILLNLYKENERALLEEHASWADHGYLFVDSEDGQCWLLDQNGQLDDIKKIDVIYEEYIKKDIKKIVIPRGIKSIENSAFFNCTSLTSIEIPESVKSIGGWAFAYCTSLKSINIQKSVKSIGRGAFYDCNSLTSIFFKGKTMDQVKAMDYYPWGIEDKAIIKYS